MIAIKDGKMPKSCSECPFKASDYVCGLLDCAFSCNHFKERNYNCPLTEIVTCVDCVYGVFGECKKFHHYTTKDDFCNFGERRE